MGTDACSLLPVAPTRQRVVSLLFKGIPSFEKIITALPLEKKGC